ncbi:MAG: ATP-dependent Clp protease proteolytic subunit [Candidatus Lloydbacteria bacterium]|nr:ATP-dependent Clp protease proteolytic subunit [Candidatus Lloydbacteria bacterium]
MRKGKKIKDDNASRGDPSGRVLSKKRKITILGDIDKKREQEVIKTLRAFNKESDSKNIYLFIDSLGGEYDSGCRIAKEVRVSKAPVYGIVMWQACSAAFHILQACKKRIACTAMSTVMCHAPDLSDVRVDQANRDKIIKKREKEHDDFLSSVVARSDGKLSLEKIHDLSTKEEDVSACRALRLGLLDQVMYKKK